MAEYYAWFDMCYIYAIQYQRVIPHVHSTLHNTMDGSPNFLVFQNVLPLVHFYFLLYDTIPLWLPFENRNGNKYANLEIG